ncbi:MAG: hypothetical protein H7062_11800 [Candidatus Saccharimonas sp.]|nr:hypothetical protein [Planctomycetaceae bacterium]
MANIPRLLMVSVLIVSRCESLVAEDALPPGAAVYDEFPAALRPSLQTAYQAEIKRQEHVVNEASTARVKTKSAVARELAAEEYEAAKRSLELLKATNRPPFVGSSIKRKAWVTGDIGEPDRPIQIMKVIGEKSALVIYNPTGTDDVVVLLNGLPTLGWSEGSYRKLKGALMVTGTTAHPTAPRDRAAVLLVEPFSWSKYRKWLDMPMP